MELFEGLSLPRALLSPTFVVHAVENQVSHPTKRGLIKEFRIIKSANDLLIGPLILTLFGLGLLVHTNTPFFNLATISSYPFLRSATEGRKKRDKPSLSSCIFSIASELEVLQAE